MRIENSILCHNSTALKRNVDVLSTELVSLVWIVKINNTRLLLSYFPNSCSAVDWQIVFTNAIALARRCKFE